MREVGGSSCNILEYRALQTLRYYMVAYSVIGS